MDYTKEKIVEMTGTDIAEHGNWIKDLDSKNDFMGADTFWLSESASRIGKTSDTKEDYTEVVGAFLLENGFIEKDNFTGVKQITKKAPYQVHTKFSPAACYLSLHFEEKFGTIVESEHTLSGSDYDLFSQVYAYNSQYYEHDVVQFNGMLLEVDLVKDLYKKSSIYTQLVNSRKTAYQQSIKHKYLNDLNNIFLFNHEQCNEYEID